MATIESSISLYDNFSPVLNNIMDAMNLTISTVRDMQSSMGSAMDTGTFEAAENAIHQAGAAMESLNQQMQAANINPTMQPVTIPVHWQTDNLEVFTNTGVDRFRQEVASANSMLEQLSSTQSEIAMQASQLDLFPPGAASSINGLGYRIEEIREHINRMASEPVELETGQANAELEHIRSTLASMIEEQNRLNRAVDDMDIAGANQSYLRMSGTIRNTERYLRDNVEEQGQFNQQIREGTTASNSLLNSIKKIAGAYLGIQGASKVIDLSDDITQTQARLQLIVDDGGSVDALQQKIFYAAQDARGDYMKTAAAISKLGTQAGDAFANNDELIAFTNLLNKEFVNAGTSAVGIESVMLQLTQSMAAGKLQGEELNAVLDNAAPIVSKIKTYLQEVQGVDAGNIKDLASEGVITAEVIKSAMFYAADDINKTFNSMPMTFSQVANSIKNNALVAFEPVLQKLNEIANSDRFNTMVNGTIGALTALADVAAEVFDLFTRGASMIYDNWSFIGPVFYGVAAAVGAYTLAVMANNAVQGISNGIKTMAAVLAVAHGTATAAEAAATTGMTAAQVGFNAALLACPLTWIVVGIIAVVAAIYIGVAAFNKLTGSAVSATGIIAGVMAVLGANIINTFIVPTWNVIAMLGNFIGNVFNDPAAAVKVLFYDMAKTVIGYIITMASAIEAVVNKIPGVTVDITSGLDGFYARLESEQQKVKDESGWKEYFKSMDYIDLGTAAGKGYEFGANLSDKASDFFKNESENEKDNPLSGITPEDYLPKLDAAGAGAEKAAQGADETAQNTKQLLDITDEELKYLRDIKERQIIDRTVYRDIHIDMSGTQNIVKNEADLDGICSRMAKKLNDQLRITMEGVG